MPAATVESVDSGSVTVEAAIALCAVTAVVGLGLAGIVAVSDQLRCDDSAREAARLIARGDHELARLAVERIAPRGAELQVRTNGDKIEVAVHSAPFGHVLPGLRLAGHAFAVAEPGVIGAVDGR
jgi:hypothetical protein